MNEKKQELLNDEAQLKIDQTSLNNIINDLSNFKSTFDKLSIDDKKEALKSIIKNIRINNNDEFEIEFNVKKN